MRGWTLLLVALSATSAACGPELPEHLELVSTHGEVRIPLATVTDDRVHFFDYQVAGTRVSFLVRTDGQGQLRTHLDACFSCYRYGQGFVVEEGQLVCRACRLEYRIADEVWDFVGACAPIDLRSTVSEPDLVITVHDLERAVRYF